MNAPLRVGVVGLGAGRDHLRAFAQLRDAFHVTVVCDLNAERSHAVAREYGVAHAATTLDEVLAHDLDLVDLCTPPHLHFGQLQAVLRAGLHAICEKPLVGSLAEVDALARLEAATGRTVTPVFQYRFGHALQKLKHLVDLGVPGPAHLATVETAWRRRADYYAAAWRGRWDGELGGSLLSHAVHAHDMLTHVLGQPTKVFCRTATRVNDIEVEDCAVATLDMPGGALATLAVTLGSSAEITRHRFCFARLSAESNTRPYTNSGDPWTFAPDSPAAEAEMKSALRDYRPAGEGYEGQFSRLARALRGEGPRPVTLTDARASLELVTALYHSARTNAPQDLPVPTTHPLYAGWRP